MAVAWFSKSFPAKWESSLRAAFNYQVARILNPSTSIPCPTAARASTALKMKERVAAVPLSYKVRAAEKSRPAEVAELRRRTLAYLITARAQHF
jgi:hypothetical protein